MLSQNSRIWIAVCGLLLSVLVAWAGAPSFDMRVDSGLGPAGCEVDFDCSSVPEGLALADLNGDGRLDAVTANNGSDDMTVFLNDGSGVLNAVETLAAGTGPTSIASADFDADGNADVAILNGFASDESDRSSVSIFLGNGDGTFADATTHRVGTFPEKIAVADFNGDGDADLATTDLFSDTVSVCLGNGDGTFAAAESVMVAEGPSGLSVGDFDADGAIDLVVTLDLAVPGEVVVLLGDGSGGFEAQTPTLAVGDTPLSVAVGDLNGDGAEDLAVPNWGEDTISVFFGNGDGSFDAGPLLVAGLLAGDAVIADLDADGANDIVSLDGLGSENADGLLVVIPGNGDGTFGEIAIFEVGSTPGALAVGDLNGDGGLDVVTAHEDTGDIGVLLNQEGGVVDCVGDCNQDGAVKIGELILGVNIALDKQPLAACPVFDRDDSGDVGVGELIAAVRNALNGCR